MFVFIPVCVIEALWFYLGTTESSIYPRDRTEDTELLYVYEEVLCCVMLYIENQKFFAAVSR